MQHYVLGFAFSSDKSEVALIRKVRPTWQAGRLNGVGGKVEDGETPVAAMRREFLEEAGVDIEETAWRHFGVLKGSGFQVWCFNTCIDLEDARAQTDEEIEIFSVAQELWRGQSISNITALVHVALSAENPFIVMAYDEDAKLSRELLDAAQLPENP